MEKVRLQAGYHSSLVPKKNLLFLTIVFSFSFKLMHCCFDISKLDFTEKNKTVRTLNFHGCLLGITNAQSLRYDVFLQQKFQKFNKAPDS